MKYPKYNLYDDSYIPEYEEYVDYCEANGIEPDEEDSQDYWDYVNHYHEYDWDDLKTNLKYSKQAQQPCLVYGTLGLWNGKPNIYPTRCESLIQAINKCCRSVDNIKIDCEDGIINVYAMHHDGTNHFYIQPLSKKGLMATSRWYDNNAGCEEYKDYWVKKYNGYLF